MQPLPTAFALAMHCDSRLTDPRIIKDPDESGPFCIGIEPWDLVAFPGGEAAWCMRGAC